jgi:uncharacterized protein
VISVELVSVRLDLPARAPVMILRERDGAGRILPILIGNAEADAIDLQLRGVVPPRPLTHDLLCHIIEELGASVTSVVVSDLREHTFYAELHLQVAGGPHVVSARPSDSIALAVRIGCPLFVADAVMDEAGQLPLDTPEPSPELLEEFQAFIDNVTPDDFS